MNLQSEISPQLWNAVSRSYEAGNYSHVILDAMHHLTNTLRERSGVDADGVSLVGQALGGESPKLLVNAFRTETERNVQRGVEQILRGLYQGVRNPRSHEQMDDTRREADAVVFFLDYIFLILKASREAFTVDGFIESLKDAEFVESKRYAEVLVAEIPAGRRADVLVALFKVRRDSELRLLRYVIAELHTLLDEPQVIHFAAAVSNELRTASADADIRSAIQMLTPELWPRIGEAARLRIENKLTKSVEMGEVLSNGKTSLGSLGTWSMTFARAFSTRKEFGQLLITKLEDVDADDRRYVAKFFLARLPAILTEEGERRRAIRAIAAAVKNNDIDISQGLITYIRTYPEPWQTELAQALVDLADATNPAVLLEGGIPFLSKPVSDEDDIPF